MHRLKAFAQAFFDPLVVVTLMTTLALIFGLLAYAGSPVSRKVAVVCFCIGIIGLITVALQVRAILWRQKIRQKLGRCLAEGQVLLGRITERDPSLPQEFAAWLEKVEGTLRTELGEPYVARLHCPLPALTGIPLGLAGEYKGYWRTVERFMIRLEQIIGELGKA